MAEKAIDEQYSKSFATKPYKQSKVDEILKKAEANCNLLHEMGVRVLLVGFGMDGEYIVSASPALVGDRHVLRSLKQAAVACEFATLKSEKGVKLLTKLEQYEVTPELLGSIVGWHASSNFKVGASCGHATLVKIVVEKLLEVVNR